MEKAGFGRWIRRRPLFYMVGGFVAAGVFGGILFILLITLVQPLKRPELRDRSLLSDGTFRIWYRPEGLTSSDALELQRTLHGELEELIAYLQIDRSSVPRPIDVFVHESLETLRESLSLRKSVNSRFITDAPLDLLADENPRGRLGELLVRFGWGRSVSRFLQLGIHLLLTYPDFDFHGPIAALSDQQLLTLRQLLDMERNGQVQQTLYNAYDSPDSPAFLVSLATLRALLHLQQGTGTVPVDLLTLEVGSVCQFIIDELGVDALKGCWGSGWTDKLLLAGTGFDSIGSLHDAWIGTARSQGKASANYPTWKARAALVEGRPEIAGDWVSRPTEEGDPEAALLYALSSLAAGNMEAFADRQQKLRALDIEGGTLDWMNGLSGGISHRVDGIVAVGPKEHAAEIMDITQRAHEARLRLPELIGTPIQSSSQTHTLLFYRTREGATTGARLFPVIKAIRSQGHFYLDNENITQKVIEDLVPQQIAQEYGELSYSHLLRAGVAHYLQGTREELLAEGVRLMEEGTWYSLSKLEVGVVDQRIVNTEAALMVDFILCEHGRSAFRDVWLRTASTGEFLSLDSALQSVCGVTRRGLEARLLDTLDEKRTEMTNTPQ